MDRKEFIQLAGLGLTSVMFPPLFTSCKRKKIPTYLDDYSELYSNNPLQASKAWFRDSKFGLFIHYGPNALVSTIDGRIAKNDWLQVMENLSVLEYEKIATDFRADKFDADFITDLALEAEMKYINLTTRHHDGFCLFDTKFTDFKSTNSPAKRDLVAELAEQCHKKKIGFCLYYSHGRDWRHPHAPNNDGWGGTARPKAKDPYYKYGKEHNLQKYLDFMTNQITELLTNYGPIANIWLDGIATPLNPIGNNKKEMFKCQELYDHIHSLQPQVLVSYKQGLTGTEDFIAPERHWKNKIDKPIEICDTLQPGQWFYNKAFDGKHKSTSEVMAMLSGAEKIGANLLLNTGPLPDGSIHPEDIKTLRGVGKLLRKG